MELDFISLGAMLMCVLNIAQNGTFAERLCAYVDDNICYLVSGWIAVHELCEYYFLVCLLPQWKIVSPVDFPLYSRQATYTQPYNGRDGKMRIEINHHQHHHKYHPKQNMSIQLYAVARFACLQYEFPMLLD